MTVDTLAVTELAGPTGVAGTGSTGTETGAGDGLAGTATALRRDAADGRATTVVRTLAVGVDLSVAFGAVSAPVLAALPRDWVRAAGPAVPDASLAAEELPESGADGAAEATAHATVEPAPTTTPATATPKQSSVTFFMMYSPVLFAVAAVQIEVRVDAGLGRIGVLARIGGTFVPFVDMAVASGRSRWSTD